MHYARRCCLTWPGEPSAWGHGLPGVLFLLYRTPIHGEIQATTPEQVKNS